MACRNAQTQTQSANGGWRPAMPEVPRLPLARLGRWQEQITTEIFPTISDSERVKMRHDRFSGMKTKNAFHPLFSIIIGDL
jgi:hypothetical protein